MQDVSITGAVALRDRMGKSAVHPLFDHWLDRAAVSTDFVPERRAVDPLAFHRLLPYIWLIERDRTTDSLRYRLVGEWVAGVHGGALKGRELAATASPVVIQDAEGYARRLLETPAALLMTGLLYRLSDGTLYRGERLALPLRSEPDAPPDALLGASVPHSNDRSPLSKVMGVGTRSGAAMDLEIDREPEADTVSTHFVPLAELFG